MGYTTNFKGVLKFTRPISSVELGYLNHFLSKDRRDIGIEDKEVYPKYGEYWYHIDYELTADFSGIKWNGAEKAYDMEHIVNFLIDKMNERFEDFGLTGKLVAQGEEVDDRWELVIVKGKAQKITTSPTGTKILCPHCDEHFYIGEE